MSSIYHISHLRTQLQYTFALVISTMLQIIAIISETNQHVRRRGPALAALNSRPLPVASIDLQTLRPHLPRVTPNDTQCSHKRFD
jgi:hypothetical protein